MRKPKEKWQAEARTKLELIGFGYKELADKIGCTEGTVRQAMCKSTLPGIKSKICEYLEVNPED